MYYKKVIIKSEADLPKEHEGWYSAHEKVRSENDYNHVYWLGSIYKDAWLRNYDYYLLPVEEELYPKEFIMWLIFEDHKFYFDCDKYKFYDEGEDYNASLKEVFEHWLNNVKNK